MEQTQNYKLNKPDITDYAKIEALNENADIIDTKLTEIIGLQSEFTTHLDEKTSKTNYGHMKVGDGLNAENGVVSLTKNNSTWIPVIAETGWVPGSGGQNKLAFYKDPFGIVHLNGLMFCSEASKSLITVLPVGYRPEIKSYFRSVVSVGLDIKIKAITIEPTGEVLCVGNTDSSFSMDLNFSFRTGV